jgi:hypothetical protein
VVEDTLEIVEDMEFIGWKSKVFYNTRKEDDERNNKMCTMPVKVKFASGQDRVNFEMSLRENCGMRAVMSLPEPIRNVQRAFADALRTRYRGKLVMVRTVPSSRSIIAFNKVDGATKWEKCPEVHVLPVGILLDGFDSKRVIRLDPALDPEDLLSEDQLVDEMNNG